MKFQEYDLVRILKDCDEGVRNGDVGTVLLSFENPVAEDTQMDVEQPVIAVQQSGAFRRVLTSNQSMTIIQDHTQVG